MINIFTKEGSDGVIARINQLQADTPGQWGKMTVAQMLAHCCVTYEMAYENIHPKPGFFARLMLKLFVKSAVVGPKPYPKNGRTAPAFLVTEEKDFATEKKRLIAYLEKTQQLGETHFDGKESHSFGPLSKEEWNTMFYKHLDHHLTQFGV